MNKMVISQDAERASKGNGFSQSSSPGIKSLRKTDLIYEREGLANIQRFNSYLPIPNVDKAKDEKYSKNYSGLNGKVAIPKYPSSAELVDNPSVRKASIMMLREGVRNIIMINRVTQPNRRGLSETKVESPVRSQGPSGLTSADKSLVHQGLVSSKCSFGNPMMNKRD